MRDAQRRLGYSLKLLLVAVGTFVVACSSDLRFAATQISSSRADAGGDAAQPSDVAGIRWPEDLRPLAVLDGPGVIAANAALQHLLVRLSKEYGATCPASAKAMEVFVGQEGGLYFVRIDQHVEKCGQAAPSFVTETDWFELYAVSPEGKVLARHPNAP
jgi:hypothetical protein